MINNQEINSFAINDLPSGEGAVTQLVTKAEVQSITFSVTFYSSDGQESVVIPISSINGTLNSDGLNSLLLVCPNGLEYGTAIALKQDGYFIITTHEKTQLGTIISVDSASFNIQTVVTDRGSKSWSISIRGTHQITTHTPSQYKAQDVISISTDSLGSRRIQLGYDSSVRPTDILILDENNNVTVKSINYNLVADPATAIMTVTEV